MTLLVAPQQPEPLTINGREYQMKPATVAERTRWRRAIAASGGRQHGPIGLLNGLAAGVRQLMKGDPEAVRDAVLGKIDAQKERVAAFFESAKAVTPGETDANKVFVEAAKAMDEGDADLAVIAAAVIEGYAPYAQMVADETTYWSIAGMEAVRLFCMGWTGIDAPFERGPAGVSEASLAEVPEQDLRAIGQAYENLVRVTPQQRKNLASPPPSSSGGETSNT